MFFRKHIDLADHILHSWRIQPSNQFIAISIPIIMPENHSSMLNKQDKKIVFENIILNVCTEITYYAYN